MIDRRESMVKQAEGPCFWQAWFCQSFVP